MAVRVPSEAAPNKGMLSAMLSTLEAAAWLCRFTGEAAKDCTIGYDFGHGDEKTVRSVEIQWVYGSATPAAIGIEYSDDNSIWTPAATLAVSPYPSSAATHRIDSFNVPESGRHRYWRIKAEQLPEKGGFAVAELRFRDKEAEAANRSIGSQ